MTVEDRTVARSQEVGGWWPLGRRVRLPSGRRNLSAYGRRPAGGWRILRGNPLAVLALLVIAGYVVLALIAPLLYPGDPRDLVGPAFLRPWVDPAFPLGTDALGRDVAAGVVHGARVSLTIGLWAVVFGTGLGVGLGLLAGYFGGLVEDVVMRASEIMETLPNIVVLVVLVAIVVPSTLTIAVIIGVLSWAPIARVVRAEVRSLREKEFVTAARGLGLGNFHIMLREILPNALPSVVVMASMMVASAILTESTLSFLGLGDPNATSWGMMINSGRSSLQTAPYLTAIPGLTILFCVLALNVLGDCLNDAFNPRSGKGR